jgi:hypothetical protein
VSVCAELRGQKMTNAAATRPSRTQFFALIICAPLVKSDNKLSLLRMIWDPKSAIYGLDHANSGPKIPTRCSFVDRRCCPRAQRPWRSPQQAIVPRTRQTGQAWSRSWIRMGMRILAAPLAARSGPNCGHCPGQRPDLPNRSVLPICPELLRLGPQARPG